jgi:hypothetical protein
MTKTRRYRSGRSTDGSKRVDVTAGAGPNGQVTEPRVVVLVEGASDRTARRTLAERCGRDLAAEGVDIVAMNGVTNIRAYASRYGPRGAGVHVVGMYDAPDEAIVRRGLAAAGWSTPLDGVDLSELGFHRCTADLEDELIRALGVEGVEAVIEAAGEGRSLRLLTGMPAQRGWSRHALLRRFLGSQSGRKARYARLVVEALPVDRVPAPLAAVLAAVPAGPYEPDRVVP